MSTLLKPCGLAAALALALAGCQPSAPADEAGTAPPPASAPANDAVAEAPMPAPEAKAPAAPQLQAAMRDLWHGHIVHARDYALAMHAGNDADAKAAAQAVVENAGQISEAVAGFYGKAGGDRMLDLLGGHWGAVKAMTDARVGGNPGAADAAMADLTANAGEIATFLSSANPHLPEETVRGMLLAHGAHHSQQVALIVADNTAGEATEWTAMQAHMDMVADALAGAIAQQFPDKAS
jgi:hypothetical protein